MKNISILIFVVMAFFLNGCRAVISKMYGYKDPTPKTPDEIIRFQHEVGFGSIPYIGLKAESWMILKNISVPDVYVFDRQGRYIPYKDTLHPNCNGPAEQFLAELNPIRHYNFSNEHSLDSFLSLYEDTLCQPAFILKNNETHFYIFMSFATFTGKKIIREKSEVWLKSLRNNRQIHYQLMMLNLDIKACWTEEQKKLLMNED